MPQIAPQVLERLTADLFRAAGMRPEHAQAVARTLIEANLVGHDSHGVLQAPRYCREIREGKIQPQAQPTILRESATTAVVSGNWGVGQALAFYCMNLAMEKAAKHDLGCVTLQKSNHIGRLGEYALTAARQGFIGIVSINGHGVGRQVAPFGGSDGRLATNPLAIGIPPARGEPLLLDMTTSVVAQGKIDLLLARGKPLPVGWILDGSGQPATDPKAFYASPPGVLLPLGGNAGYKGFGLSMMVEVLSGALSGAGCSHTQLGDISNAVFMLALRVEAFVERAEFDRHVEAMIRHVRASPPLKGFQEILLPGELEFRTRRERMEKGIDIEEATWQRLCECAQGLGVAVPTVPPGRPAPSAT